MTGTEATAAIRRADAERGNTGRRIFGLTGNALCDDVSEFLVAGCDEVDMKPITSLISTILTVRCFESTQVLTKPLNFDLFRKLLVSYRLFPDGINARKNQQSILQAEAEHS